MLVALNAENDDDCIKGVWNTIRKRSKEYGISNHKQLRAILVALKNKHSRIAKYIASGYGVKLQNLDAKIAENIINYFTSINIPILTVHDSFICNKLDEYVLKDYMEQFYVATINKFLQLNHHSFMDEIRYDEDFKLNKDIGDIIINIDRKSLDKNNRKKDKKDLNKYSQGRRQLKWMLTGETTFFKKVSGIY